MVWGGRREEVSGWGTHVYLWQIHVDIWQNQHNIVKLKKIKEKKKESSPTPQFKSINSLTLSLLYSPPLTSITDYLKTIALTWWTFVGKVMSLLFNMLSRLVIAFLPRSKRLLISWLQSLSAVILEPTKIEFLTVSIVSHLFFIKWWDQMPWTPFFERRVLSQLFHSPLSPSSRGILALHFLPLELYLMESEILELYAKYFLMP